MKSKIFVAVSIFLFFLFSLINMFSAYNRSIGAFNFILSFIFIVFWCILIAILSDSRGIMIFSIAVWSVTFIASLIVLISAITGTGIDLLMVPSTFLVSPMTGIGALIKLPVASFSVMMVISAGLTAWSAFSLVRKSRY